MKRSVFIPLMTQESIFSFNLYSSTVFFSILLTYIVACQGLEHRQEI